jgi:hypothetical protein
MEFSLTDIRCRIARSRMVASLQFEIPTESKTQRGSQMQKGLFRGSDMGDSSSPHLQLPFDPALN